MKFHPDRLRPQAERLAMTSLWDRIRNLTLDTSGEPEDEALDRDIFLQLAEDGAKFEADPSSPRHVIPRLGGEPAAIGPYSANIDFAMSLVPKDSRWVGIANKEDEALVSVFRRGEAMSLAHRQFFSADTMAAATVLAVLNDKMRREVAYSRMSWFERCLDLLGLLRTRKDTAVAA